MDDQDTQNFDDLNTIPATENTPSTPTQPLQDDDTSLQDPPAPQYKQRSQPEPQFQDVYKLNNISMQKKSIFVMPIILMGLLTGLAQISTSPEFVNFIAQLLWPLAIIASVTFGIAAAKLANRRIGARNSGMGYETNHPLKTIGVVLCVIGVFTFVALIPGIICLVIGIRKGKKFHSPKSQISNYGKYASVGLSF